MFEFPARHSPRWIFVVLHANWIILGILLLRWLILAFLAWGLFPLLGVHCLIRPIIQLWPSIGNFCLTVDTFFLLISSSFRNTSPFLPSIEPIYILCKWPLSTYFTFVVGGLPPSTTTNVITGGNLFILHLYMATNVSTNKLHSFYS